MRIFTDFREMKIVSLCTIIHFLLMSPAQPNLPCKSKIHKLLKSKIKRLLKMSRTKFYKRYFQKKIKKRKIKIGIEVIQVINQILINRKKRNIKLEISVKLLILIKVDSEKAHFIILCILM